MLDRQAEERSQQEVLRDMSLSVFCLAASGAGWGVRLQQSIMMGCIPVVVAPDVEVSPTLALSADHGSSMVHMLVLEMMSVQRQGGRVLMTGRCM